jgi:hypothetical protein
MVASVFTKKQSAADKMLQLKVFINNAIQDQIQVYKRVREGERSLIPYVCTVFVDMNWYIKLIPYHIIIQALDKTLSEKGYGCLERNIPILCFGDGKDMELTLCSDSNSQMPLGTRVSHMTPL